MAARQQLWLDFPLVADPGLPRFLESGPVHLLSWGPSSASSAVGDVLKRCASLRKLECYGGLLPTAFPPGLCSFEFSNERSSDLPEPDDDLTGCAAEAERLAAVMSSSKALSSLQHLLAPSESAVREAGSLLRPANCSAEAARQRRLVNSLQSLSSLTELVLSCGCCNAEADPAANATIDVFVGAQLTRLSSLQLLGVFVLCGTCMRHFDLRGFSALAAAGIRTEVCIEFTSAHHDPPPPRAALWDALSQAGTLPQLTLDFSQVCWVPFIMSAAEQHLLASVQCHNLELKLGFDAGLCDLVLPWLDYQVAHVISVLGRAMYIPWAALSARPGVLVFSKLDMLTVTGCAWRLPFAEGWALVLKQEQQGAVSGLPLRGFRTTSRGHLVWGDSPALRQGALAAEIGSVL